VFHHVKELQFNARVSGPDPRFARLLLEQFGGGNGELKAAMQYFIQAFGCRRSHPHVYDMLMDIATEEFSHLEIVGATITMLLAGVNGELKDAVEKTSLAKVMNGKNGREELLHEALTSPHFLVHSGGGPMLTDCNGVPWTGSYINANGDLTVDLRSDIGAESRAKIVYEYLKQFTEDPLVQESLSFLMTREVSHFQMFSAALEEIQPNFPPGILQGDARFSHTYFNMSQGESARGPWNQGTGPWEDGGSWEYVEKPLAHVRETQGLSDQASPDNGPSPKELRKMEEALAKERSTLVKKAMPPGAAQWSTYDREPVLKEG
jgi:Mn-containing catalase